MNRTNIVGRVVNVVAVVAVLAVLGIIGLAITEQAIPDVLQNIAIGSVTGLLGLLAKTSDGPDEVVVTNRPGEPVPVVDH